MYVNFKENIKKIKKVLEMSRKLKKYWRCQSKK